MLKSQFTHKICYPCSLVLQMTIHNHSTISFLGDKTELFSRRCRSVLLLLTCVCVLPGDQVKCRLCYSRFRVGSDSLHF